MVVIQNCVGHSETDNNQVNFILLWLHQVANGSRGKLGKGWAQDTPQPAAGRKAKEILLCIRAAKKENRENVIFF